MTQIRMKLVLAILLGHALLSTAAGQFEDCGVANPGGLTGKSAIVNGDQALPHEFPWVAVVKCLDSGDVCTGSVIGDRWVMTSAQCVEECDRWEVTVGVYDRGDPDAYAQTFTTTRGYVNKEFVAWSYSNDIALVGLPQALEFNGERVG